MGTIELRCAHCGSEDFLKPANPKPHDVVTCARCGASDTWDNVQRKTLEAAQKALRDALAKSGLKFK